MPARISFGNLVLEVEERTLWHGEARYHLTPKECLLLALFLTHPGQVLTRQYLMQAVWETDFVEDTRTVEVHVHWLRQKLDLEPGRPSCIRTVRGVGYLLVDDEMGVP